MTSQPITSPTAAPHNGARVGPSREELAELERELNSYLTFWAYVRDHPTQQPRDRERA